MRKGLHFFANSLTRVHFYFTKFLVGFPRSTESLFALLISGLSK